LAGLHHPQVVSPVARQSRPLSHRDGVDLALFDVAEQPAELLASVGATGRHVVVDVDIDQCPSAGIDEAAEFLLLPGHREAVVAPIL
jgi:hypothetical protein